MKNVVVLAEASDDLWEAKLFYDRIEMGVGDYCTRSLLGDIERLGTFHGIHPIRLGCHRALGSKFPFGIYYLNERDEIQIVAVLDLRRKPSWIRSEIKRRRR